MLSYDSFLGGKMFNYIIQFIQALNANSKPSQIANSFCIGLILGLMPKNNLLWYVLFVFFMFVRIKNCLINTEEIAFVEKKSTSGGATIAVYFKTQSVNIYFYNKEEERDAAFEFLSTTLLKEEA